MGLAFIFIPSNVLSYVNIPREKNNQISSMINFVRNIGGSIGIALVEHIRHPQHAKVAELPVGERSERQPAISPDGGWHRRYIAAAWSQSRYGDCIRLTARIELLLQQQAASLAYRDMISTMAIAVDMSCSAGIHHEETALPRKASSPRRTKHCVSTIHHAFIVRESSCVAPRIPLL